MIGRLCESRHSPCSSHVAIMPDGWEKRMTCRGRQNEHYARHSLQAGGNLSQDWGWQVGESRKRENIQEGPAARKYQIWISQTSLTRGLALASKNYGCRNGTCSKPRSCRWRSWDEWRGAQGCQKAVAVLVLCSNVCVTRQHKKSWCVGKLQLGRWQETVDKGDRLQLKDQRRLTGREEES